MATSQRKLAETAGVSLGTIENAKKTLGITSKTISKADEKAILEEVRKTVDLKASMHRKSSVKSDGFTPNVRRIDKQDESTVLEMLMDCKEQYVSNEGLIQRLQYEVSRQDILMHGNSNGTLSPLPQLGILEKFQKINIQLRNQILQLEQELGRYAKTKQEDNPFD